MAKSLLSKGAQAEPSREGRKKIIQDQVRKMRYQSTRGLHQDKSFTQIILEGMAADAGLFIPQHYPRIDDIYEYKDLEYHDLAASIIGLFADDIDRVDLSRICKEVYTESIFSNLRLGVPALKARQITPLTVLEDNLALVELSNGPTLAFKDLAMQFLAAVFNHVLKGRKINILAATSGDTGSAAEYAFRAYPNINVFMLSPKENMSDFQKAQMYSLSDPNIFNLVIDGPFDQAQDLVKEVNADLDFKTKFNITAVNSINFARIAAQIVYYFKAYFLAIDSFASTSDEFKVDFVVPSGNFGNVYAGHVAKQMGLPIRNLVVATNENNVLEQFFKSGIYRPWSPESVKITSSPSMDIAKASNFERFISDLFDRKQSVVNQLWQQILQKGFFDISDSFEFKNLRERFGFLSSSSTHSDRLKMISKYANMGFIIDPHTADGLSAAQKLDFKVPVLVMETAKPDKFDAVIRQAGLEGFEISSIFKSMLSMPRRTFSIGNSAEELKDFIRRWA